MSGGPREQHASLHTGTHPTLSWRLAYAAHAQENARRYANDFEHGDSSMLDVLETQRTRSARGV